MGKGSEAPPPPDYSMVSTASADAAKLQSQTSDEQLAWAKDQYAEMAPVAQQYMGTMILNQNEQTRNAINDRTRYEHTFQPVEDQIVSAAKTWNSADRSEQQAGAAMADVAKQFDAQRKQATAQLESFGVDPSQTRYGALDLGTRISQAATQAAAGTNSRLDTERTALALAGEAAQIGRNYPGQSTQGFAGAASSGGAAVNTGLQTSSTFGNLKGTAAQWLGLSNQSNSTATGALQAAGNYNLGATHEANSVSNAQTQGIGQVGGALLAAAMFG